MKRRICRIAGIDEVGRGPLAGPLVAAAVVLEAVGEAEGWRQIGSYIQGVASVRLKKTKQAEDAFKKAASYGLMSRETADSYYQLGLLALDEKRADDAVGYFTKAGEFATTDDTLDIRAGSYLQLGRAYESLENWSDAGRYYLSVGVLFDDPELTPESLYRAAGRYWLRRSMRTVLR